MIENPKQLTSFIQESDFPAEIKEALRAALMLELSGASDNQFTNLIEHHAPKELSDEN